jgi:hypothetical protein
MNEPSINCLISAGKLLRESTSDVFNGLEAMRQVSRRMVCLPLRPLIHRAVGAHRSEIDTLGATFWSPGSIC